MDFFKQQKII